MATAFSINQYRDPGHVDMSATFKAQTYSNNYMIQMLLKHNN